MDEQKENIPEEELPETPVEEKPVYVPRPIWQVWMARVGLVLFILVILLYYANMMRGG